MSRGIGRHAERRFKRGADTIAHAPAWLKSLAAKLAPAILWMLWIVSLATAADEQPITYEDHVAGVMKKHCTTCHGDGKQETELSLVSYSGLMKGAGGGEIVIAGRSGGDRLIEVITAPDDGERMPPEGEPLVLASSRSGRLLLAASRCKAARSYSSMWRPKKRLVSVADEPDSIIAADISPDEQYLATGDRIGNIHLWDGKTGGVLDGRFGPQGELATRSRDGLVTLWSPEGKELQKFTVADTTRADKKPLAGVSLAADPPAHAEGFYGTGFYKPQYKPLIQAPSVSDGILCCRSPGSRRGLLWDGCIQAPIQAPIQALSVSDGIPR